MAKKSKETGVIKIVNVSRSGRILDFNQILSQDMTKAIAEALGLIKLPERKGGHDYETFLLCSKS